MSVLTGAGAEHRFDHQSYAPELWTGLLITGLYLLQTDPLIDTLEDHLERALDLTMTVGSLLCLIGCAVGTRWFFPKAKRSVSYTFQLLGLPLIIAALAWYTYSAADFTRPSLLLTALGGGLGLCIEIGSLRMFIDLVAATRKLP